VMASCAKAVLAAARHRINIRRTRCAAECMDHVLIVQSRHQPA
jgi:hypothetical protein